jgi:hypothetical protein
VIQQQFDLSEKRLPRKLRKSLEDGLSNAVRAGGVLTGDDLPIDDDAGFPRFLALVLAYFTQLQKQKHTSSRSLLFAIEKKKKNAGTLRTLSSSLNGTYFVFLTASSSALENPVNLRPAKMGLSDLSMTLTSALPIVGGRAVRPPFSRIRIVRIGDVRGAMTHRTDDFARIVELSAAISHL